MHKFLLCHMIDVYLKYLQANLYFYYLFYLFIIYFILYNLSIRIFISHSSIILVINFVILKISVTLFLKPEFSFGFLNWENEMI